MATIEQLLAGVGLSSGGQTKTAAAAVPTSSEVNQVLENLGIFGGIESLDAASVTKTASAEGTNMTGLTDIYDSMFGAEEAASATDPGQTKVAAAAPEAAATADANEDGDPSTSLGELTGIYYNVQCDEFVEKIAGDLEAEAGKGFKPQGAGERSELSKIIGKEGDPAIAVNYDASSGAGLKVNPGNQTPYMINAHAKEILKRRVKSEAGDVGGYKE